VGTVGEIEVDPGLINAIASRVRFSLDIRGPVEEAYRGVAREVAAFAERAAEARGMRAEFRQRQALPATPLDERIVDALEAAAKSTGEPYLRMHSGAAHDTMCVADRVPSAMVFVPCRDGISHHPAEDADPADAALAAGVILDAIAALR
jgi:acetylornithine deacetylase/succinyl-diaminopimelate desuccinylase-like protein